MRYLIALGHPAHYHLFKHVASGLIKEGHTVHYAIRNKDVLRQLLLADKLDFTELGQRRSGLSKRKWLQYAARIRDLVSLVRSFKPDLMMGTNGEVAHVGFLMRIPNILLTEDDYHVTPLYAKTCFPFARHILVPDTCELGPWERKGLKYPSYHELAYLHPNQFSPDRAVVNKYFPDVKSFFILRFVQLNAHHDRGIRGISNSLAIELVERLKQEGEVYISSERPLCAELQPHRISIAPEDMHHVLAFASLFVGDSQTMAAECAVLGTPYIRFNDFVGRIGYLNELEEKYHLGTGIKASNPDALMITVDAMLKDSDLWMLQAARRTTMLADKVDAAAFLTETFSNYPAGFRKK